MQFGELLDTDNNLMIIFEGDNDELKLGVAVINNLLDAMERKKGHGVPEMRLWLENVKRKIEAVHTVH